MNKQSSRNQTAWNYRAYEFWNQAKGTPHEFAKKLLQDPKANINPRYADLLADLQGKRMLNALGSNGRIAVPMALLGAEVHIVDISEENRRYALELAQCAHVNITYEVADFSTYHNERYDSYFDIAFSEGGILHYFGDLDAFFCRLASFVKKGGCLILNDFHPFRKLFDSQIGTDGNYFDSDLHEGPVAYESEFAEAERKSFPKCLLRFYRIGEIITSIGKNGFWIKEMRELKKFGMEKVPGEFTIVAEKL
jgi:2-polyprenyl-3-methyl-5-hydroxy-6-metoxy-1,4-benzoquinol methylase